MKPIFTSILFIIIPLFLLTSCGDFDIKPGEEVSPNDGRPKKAGKLFGDINLLGGDRNKEPGRASDININAFLWRASLDTLSFLPLSSADPFGGVIITDWYSPPESPNERLKVTAYLIGRQLRSDGIRVSTFKQEYNSNAGWVNKVLDEMTNSKLEDAILSRARELRVSSKNQ
jgi:hypothetical protein